MPAREATRKVTVDMLGEKSLQDWNTLQNSPYTHRDKEYRDITAMDCWIRKSIAADTGEESYYIGNLYRNQGIGTFTQTAGILANILCYNKDINPEWVKTFTWTKWSSNISFPEIGHFTDRSEVFAYLCKGQRKRKLFGSKSTIKFNENLKWTYLGNITAGEGGVYLVVLNGKARICQAYGIMRIIATLYCGKYVSPSKQTTH